MNISKRLIGLSASIAMVMSSGSAMAITLGSNITVSDKNYTGAPGDYVNPPAQTAGVFNYGDHEDQETETNPSTILAQVWDLEGMFVDGNTLSLVGGYDFKNGVNYGGYLYKGGDIFIDVNGDAKYGPANSGSGVGGTVKDNFGFDYALRLDFATGTFQVYELDSNSYMQRALDVPSSNPWRYVVQAGEASDGQGTFTYAANLSDADVGNNLVGGTHYALSLDISFLLDQLSEGDTALFHYTMECGNDNLVGSLHVPDLGSTAILLGGSLAGIIALRKKFAVKA